ncbi:OsmC-like protein [Corynebacterium faecale]|uniref:OsmC family protein n=1 Tax=Corynebacterium faecale TaxID=1758466 RepID=UPI0025B360A7|nr:OsmC family protein [Corynebacterium faecale]WJY92788.1 OsmC-like protein [Corynebacterium faecale]
MSTDSSTTFSLTATRTGSWTYTVDNGRGATVDIGLEGADGAFSPVELLQAALAGCAALSAEAQLVNKLGENAEVSSVVDFTHDADTNRITSLTNLISADMSSLDIERREKLIAAAERSIGILCTVKTSLNHGVEASTTVTAAP